MVISHIIRTLCIIVDCSYTCSQLRGDSCQDLHAFKVIYIASSYKSTKVSKKAYTTKNDLLSSIETVRRTVTSSKLTKKCLNPSRTCEKHFLEISTPLLAELE